VASRIWDRPRAASRAATPASHRAGALRLAEEAVRRVNSSLGLMNKPASLSTAGQPIIVRKDPCRPRYRLSARPPATSSTPLTTFENESVVLFAELRSNGRPRWRKREFASPLSPSSYPDHPSTVSLSGASCPHAWSSAPQIAPMVRP